MRVCAEVGRESITGGDVDPLVLSVYAWFVLRNTISIGHLANYFGDSLLMLSSTQFAVVSGLATTARCVFVETL